MAPLRHSGPILPAPLARHKVLVVVLIGVFLVLIFSPAFQSKVDKAAQWTIQFAESEPFWGAFIFVWVSAISAMMAFFSNAVLVPPAVVVWGESGTFVLLWAGWTLGAVIAYTLGRSAAPLVERMGYEQKMAKYREAVSSRMRFWQAVLFCLAVPSEIPGYLFGSARYSFGKFLAAIGIAEAVYAGVLVFLGQQVADFRPSKVLLVTGALTVVILAVLFVRRRSRLV